MYLSPIRLSFLHKLPTSTAYLGIALVFRLFSPISATLSILMLGLYPFIYRRPYTVLQSLLLTSLFGLINPAFTPPTVLGGNDRYICFLLVFLYTLTVTKSRLTISRPSFILLLFFPIIVLHSIVFSQFPLISLLKAFLLFFISFASIESWFHSSSQQRAEFFHWSFTILSLVIILSLPTYFISSIGFAVNGTGFQGILSQPQVFGVVLATYLSIAFNYLFNYVSFRRIVLPLFLLALFMLYSTASRTAFFAFLLALFLSFVVHLSLNFSSYKHKLKHLPVNTLFVVVSFFGILGIFLTSVRVQSLIGSILFKSDNAAISLLDQLDFNSYQLYIEIFASSREVLYLPMLDNISTHLFQGIGFGVPSVSSSMSVAFDPFFGIPVGASIEKGVLFVAILEELGLILFIPFLLLFLLILRSSLRNGYGSFLVCLTILLTNIGESTLFSPGGIGLLLICLLIPFSFPQDKFSFRLIS
ncbi:putative membrane protein [Synechococcus sp. Minos11]|uniref:hypothetical protein n=1 Tax=Synechococcus sp. Minos11 TaxID=221341 RepID=UPI001648CC85|nr:hypothetical protein [Synechococcus sp. Minos11]QNJ07701.1 putative membrane protein [Synechococcus sp. Minos11]